MRIRIIFSVNNRGACIPFYHQHLLEKMIRETIASTEYKNYPYFHFSGLKGQTRTSRNGLHICSSKVTLVLSSENEHFLKVFLQNLFTRKKINIGLLSLLPESVEQEMLPTFTKEMKYLCISPIALVNPVYDYFYAKKFISPEYDIFSDLLYESTMSRMEKLGIYTEEQISSFNKFQVVPDREYLNKIKREDKKFARIYSIYEQNVRHELRGYVFPFTLYAAVEVQEFVYKCGLGSCTHKGFGMLDVAYTEASNRTISYSLEEFLVS
ncbi:MAG: CRISPR-associated protein Cas6 [Microscillaceae bacterium]|nr:CRISPR-associated protein Cas6 [Microscillaceae bacterium]MDW8460306.1 CRISPR-associated endoribonuclease Cas6 [Cytophagales bacterium]